MASDLKGQTSPFPWPPVVYIAAATLGFLAQMWEPRPLGVDAPARIPGLILLIAGIALGLWTVLTMRRARMSAKPDRLLAYGPFAISRNPIYLGATIAVIGLAGALNSLWLLLAAFAAAGLTSVLAIRREEAQMALRFGPIWQAYCARTPRWIGRASFGRGRKA